MVSGPEAAVGFMLSMTSLFTLGVNWAGGSELGSCLHMDSRIGLLVRIRGSQKTTRDFFFVGGDGVIVFGNAIVCYWCTCMFFIYTALEPLNHGLYLKFILSRSCLYLFCRLVRYHLLLLCQVLVYCTECTMNGNGARSCLFFLFKLSYIYRSRDYNVLYILLR